ncbi:SDR family oxidoreductase [Hymenobacter properus]|uniref:SDR family oxidoreductase n=1 Tax=Hymenobacter properus TaxID=2791026 RepID=A0A931FMD9_9BACT|nr:SDR family oxidoreductase [Hymenobacter properus]MBF9141584.1 SDR family oxidoreductase [Hymenobacter properus]MBR7720393.1 SDR family oxidoreductase [Microvirga sp. SRT04]
MSTSTTPGFLTNKRVVILGGSAGIGLATAQAAAAEGALVVIASSNQARVDGALQTLPAGSEGYALDLTNEAQVQTFFAQRGAFDHLIFTAGESLQLGEVATTGLDAMRRAFELRYFGAITAVKYAQPHLRPGGSVVLTTGIASRRPGKGWAVGASICGAMDGLTRALAVELAPIRVNAVSPGIVRTDLWASIPEAEREAMYASFSQQLLTRRVGEAVEVAQTYLYLLRQSFSTGQIVVVDGGGVLV